MRNSLPLKVLSAKSAKAIEDKYEMFRTRKDVETRFTTLHTPTNKEGEVTRYILSVLYEKVSEDEQ